MLVDGERIKDLLRGAESEIILCAPFIKAQVLRVLVSVASDVPMRVYTRWRPAEVAAGVSDLDVFHVVSERANTELLLLDLLHAKLYVADSNCLVGSANLTASALGWCPEPNIEILLHATRSSTEVSRLLERLKSATPATLELLWSIEEQVADLGESELPEARGVPQGQADLGHLSTPWLPRCATPGKLFMIYKDPMSTAVISGTRDDGKADLEALAPPLGLNEADFKRHVANELGQIPSFLRILDSIPGRLTDAQGAAIIEGLRPSLTHSDLEKQWHIVRDWIGTFFGDRFEVAPESFVVRLKPRTTRRE